MNKLQKVIVPTQEDVGRGAKYILEFRRENFFNRKKYFLMKIQKKYLFEIQRGG